VFASSFDSKRRVAKVAILGSEYSYKYATTDTFVTDDANRVTRLSHNGDGLTTSIVSPNGLVSELVLDDSNRVTSLLHNGSPVAKFGYNREGAVEVVTRLEDSRAVEVKYDYDTSGRLVRIGSTDGAGVVLEYNPVGDLVRKTEADRTQEFAYSAQGNLSLVTDRGVSTSYTHNSYGQIETVKGPSGSARLSYLPDGKLKAIEFSDGTVHEYRYNLLGFRERVERNDGSRTTYVYDVAGNLVHSEGHKHTAEGETVGQDFEINANNQPTVISLSNGDSINVTYDATGNPQRITTADPDAPALEYLYDANNRLVAVQDGEAVSGSYQYEDTEPDLRLQMDYRTARIASGAVRQSASIGDIASIMYARPYGGALGSLVQ
jgi:YD repeat-containing protein